MHKIKILGLDSCNQKCSVAIYENNTLLAEKHCNEPNKQAEILFSLIENVLLDSSLVYSDINFLAVTTGPGSFTGVRIGLSAAQGIIIASNILPIGITTLEAVNFCAMEYVRNYDYSIVLMNAYRMQLYAQIFDINGNSISAPCLIDVDYLNEYLDNIKGKIVIIGSGLEFISESILNSNRIIAIPRFPNSEARTVAQLAYRKILSNNYNRNIVPLYIRPPDAKLSK